MLLTLLFKGVGCVHLDFVTNWVAAERQQEAEETPWRAVVAAMVLAASLAAVLTPAAIAAAALLGWLG
jgi:hypothetical protein